MAERQVARPTTKVNMGVGLGGRYRRPRLPRRSQCPKARTRYHLWHNRPESPSARESEAAQQREGAVWPVQVIRRSVSSEVDGGACRCRRVWKCMCCGWVLELGAIQLVSASLGFLVGASGGALEAVPHDPLWCSPGHVFPGVSGVWVVYDVPASPFVRA